MADGHPLCFAYYCSGHGYGHATRVSAFTRHLLSLQPKPIVHIISSAPKHVFCDSVREGALYRYAEIDPVIVQPLAYRVDRHKSVDVLQAFLERKDTKLLHEVDWLKSIDAQCVLSDAAFLGCLAAHHAAIPSVLITNFTFDSVYSYLSTPFIEPIATISVDAASLSPPSPVFPELAADIPVPAGLVAPLVNQILAGYRHADLLLRLPGAIPIPSFSMTPALPTPAWVDQKLCTFTHEVISHLFDPPSGYALHPNVADSSSSHKIPRSVVSAPLLVRSPNPSVYTSAGRSRLLSSIGIPEELHDPKKTKILIVSFGGQTFHKPQSCTPSHLPSRAPTPQTGPGTPTQPHTNGNVCNVVLSKPLELAKNNSPDLDVLVQALQRISVNSPLWSQALPVRRRRAETNVMHIVQRPVGRPRAYSQLNIPGAPRAAVLASPPLRFTVFPPSQTQRRDKPLEAEPDLKAEPRLLPDASWVAVVCGVSKGWGTENGETLPDAFFVAPRDVYMPDLTAAADVLLGKLGYGTVSECVDACTPFVYVPRPLFVEEHGLRLLLDSEGVGAELSRHSYEIGDWADTVQEAWTKGREAKLRKRSEGETGKRSEQGREMARDLVEWVHKWRADMGDGSVLC